MRIEDVFEFADGRTVFIGTPQGAAAFIEACDCELWIGGVKVATMRIEPEMLPLRRRRDGLRAVSTTTSITADWDQIRNKSAEAWIRCGMFSVEPAKR